MNPFTEAIRVLGLSPYSKGDAKRAYGALMRLARIENARPQGSACIDPVQEVLRRLGARCKRLRAYMGG